MLLVGLLSGSSASGTSADAAARLVVFNHALAELGSHPLSDLTTANTRLYELEARWDSAIEYVLSQADWNFARARATLTAAASGGFPPYTKEYSKPANYLRKCWIKASADDEFQIDHAETISRFYGFVDSAVIEYISNSTDSRNPGNWPPQFTRAVSLYLAFLVAPKLARAGDDVLQRLWSQFQGVINEAKQQEALFSVNAQVASDRLPVMRRAIEMLGQEMAGAMPVHAHADKLRWAMNRAWTHSVKYVLSQAAWNFATKRSHLSNGAAGESVIAADATSGIIEGYSVPPASSSADPLDYAGYDYGFPLPDDFLHKVWIKADARHEDEIPHQIVRDYIFTNYDECVMEYVTYDDWTQDPGNWPVTFTEAVAAYLALTVAPEFMIEQGGDGKARVKQQGIRQALEAMYLAKLSDGKVKDAVQQYPKQPPAGSFARARRGGTSFRMH